MKKLTYKMVAAELQDLRDEYARWHTWTDEMTRRLDICGHWLAAQPITKTNQRLMSEVSRLTYDAPEMLCRLLEEQGRDTSEPMCVQRLPF